MANPRNSVGLVGHLMIVFIRFYQLTLSSILGRSCRHLPTCSNYGIEAIQKHGAMKGFFLGFSRVIRCNPWGSEGFDPVPESLPNYGWRIWRYGIWRTQK